MIKISVKAQMPYMQQVDIENKSGVGWNKKQCSGGILKICGGLPISFFHISYIGGGGV